MDQTSVLGIGILPAKTRPSRPRGRVVWASGRLLLTNFCLHRIFVALDLHMGHSVLSPRDKQLPWRLFYHSLF